MRRFRSLLAGVVALVLSFSMVPEAVGANPSIGVLTFAAHAHLEGAVAFPGLSIFEGERLSTEAEGRLGIRAGHAVLTLGEQTEVWLIPLNGGLHVDMSQGSFHFTSVEREPVEIHVAEAIVSPAGTQASQGSVTLLGPKILQITAERGDLNFSFRGEFRTLPQGQTYRIYLDGPAATVDTATGSGGASTTAGGGKVAYFIVGAGVASATAWGIHEAVRSGNLPISPMKP
ncbi:MAG TPA: hypothetical protein VMU53_13510 [Candidatus Sulfotelmatobacter sp.]|nr:hypothetical protein [Candidatus Sulfotelmatobacter sp.]